MVIKFLHVYMVSLVWYLVPSQGLKNQADHVYWLIVSLSLWDTLTQLFTEYLPTGTRLTWIISIVDIWSQISQFWKKKFLSW